MSSKTPSRKQKELVKERARRRCEYCLCPASFSPFTFQIDQILPYSRGGKTELDNLALSCGCNGFKANWTQARDPQTNRMIQLFNPRQHNWATHFRWSNDFLKIIGRTPTGRATIVALRMNRIELTNLREVLRAAGKHPPTD